MKKWVNSRRKSTAYAIGVAEPVSFSVETFGTETGSGRDSAAELAAEFDRMRPV
jgi:S-adenosylmethionine synthetase